MLPYLFTSRATHRRYRAWSALIGEQINAYGQPDSTQPRHIVGRRHWADLQQRGHHHRRQPAEDGVGDVVRERQAAERLHRDAVGEQVRVGGSPAHGARERGTDD